MPAVREAAIKFSFCSDASGSWGCGAWYGQQWFQIPWDKKLIGWHIELLPIVVAAVLLGRIGGESRSVVDVTTRRW